MKRAILFLLVIAAGSIPALAKYSGGTGEPNTPYQIATAADLLLLMLAHACSLAQGVPRAVLKQRANLAEVTATAKQTSSEVTAGFPKSTRDYNSVGPPGTETRRSPPGTITRRVHPGLKLGEVHPGL